MWDTPTFVTGYGYGTASGTWSGAGYTSAVTRPGVAYYGYDIATNHGRLLYSGPPVNCNWHVHITVSDSDLEHDMLGDVSLKVEQDGVLVLNDSLEWGTNGFPAVGSYDISFAISAGTNSVIDVYTTFDMEGGEEGSGDGDGEGNGLLMPNY